MSFWSSGYKVTSATVDCSSKSEVLDVYPGGKVLVSTVSEAQSPQRLGWYGVRDVDLKGVVSRLFSQGIMAAFK